MKWRIWDDGKTYFTEEKHLTSLIAMVVHQHVTPGVASKVTVRSHPHIILVLLNERVVWTAELLLTGDGVDQTGGVALHR